MTLRCHSCSHGLGDVSSPMRIAGIFKASLMGKVGRAHAEEIRKRCQSCGWVNVFLPMSIGRIIERNVVVPR